MGGKNGIPPDFGVFPPKKTGGNSSKRGGFPPNFRVFPPLFPECVMRFYVYLCWSFTCIFGKEFKKKRENRDFLGFFDFVRIRDDTLQSFWVVPDVFGKFLVGVAREVSDGIYFFGNFWVFWSGVLRNDRRKC